jgi:hypothetical protein
LKDHDDAKPVFNLFPGPTSTKLEYTKPSARTVAKFVDVCGSSLSISKTDPITSSELAAFAGVETRVPAINAKATPPTRNLFLLITMQFLPR